MDTELLNQEKSLVAMCKFLLWLFTALIITFVGISNVFGATITDFATKYYYYNSNDNSSINSTVYRTGDNNFVTLFGAEPPTYDNGEGFNGFYNQINYKIVKGSIYTLTLNIQYTNLLDSEFYRNDINNRLLTTDFAHCDGCNVTAVSGSIRRYNNISGIANNLYDFVVQMSYTFVATYTTNTFYIGSYTGDDRVLGVDNHLYNSIVSVYSLEINENNSSTIINQNETIINQNQQIIDQNNTNTQDIINNNNTNTENILNNQNENTEKEIESQKVCTYIDKNYIQVDNKYLNSSAIESDSQYFGITDYIKISEDDKITPISVNNNITYTYSCFYNVNKILLSCVKNSDMSINTNLSIPINSVYIRFTINKNNNQPTLNFCKNGNQALTDSITDLNDSLNDDDSSGATSEASDFFNSFTTNTFGLTSIITAPLNLIQSLTSSTCSELHLPMPYLNNKYLDLPCMTSIYQTHFGLFFTMYQTITYGIIAYWVCVRIFNQVKDFKNPEHDEIEVVDL